MRLEGKTALVTGATRNIGKAIALDFASEGARVAINARFHKEEAELVAWMARDMGTEAIAVMADVSEAVQVREMVHMVVSELGPIDILVSNVGVRIKKPFDQMSYEEWRHVLSINLDASFLLARQVVPSMKQRRWGRIITVSGVGAVAGASEWAHVCASKMGLIGLTRALAVELGPYNILVNNLSPGGVRDVDYDGGNGSRVPPPSTLMGRVGRPFEVARVCTMLCSDDGGWITGQTIHIDGGSLRIGS